MLSDSIYPILTSIPHNRIHVNRYVKFIELCLKLNRSLTEESYTERHHAVPKSLFPQYESEKEFIVRLTARQHFIAHMILHKTYGGVMSKAFHKFQSPSNSQRAHYPKITAKQYAVLREEVVRWSRKRFTGRYVTDETKRRQRESQLRYIERLKSKGKKHHNSRRFTEEHRLALSKAHMGIKPYNSSYYDVYDNNGNLIYTFYTNFREHCYEVGLPASPLVVSYLSGGQPIYPNGKVTLAGRKRGYHKYIGWYAVKRQGSNDDE